MTEQEKLNKAFEQSEVLQLLRMGNPEKYSINGSGSTDQISVVDLENTYKPYIKNLVMSSDDPAGVVAKEDLTQILMGSGIDEKVARNIAENDGLSLLSDMDVRNKTMGEQLVITFKNAYNNEIKGLAAGASFLFEIPELKRVADARQNKIISNPESRDYGLVGNLVLDGVQPLMSSLSFMATTAVMSWLPSGFGLQAAARTGAKIAGGVNFLKAGLSQGGNVMYDLSLIEDSHHNKIDMESPGAKALGTALVVLMGGVEMWSLDQVPGYKQLTKHFTGQEIKQFISEGILDSAKKYTWDILKGAGAEGIEEGVQTFLGAGFENLLKHIANKEGADFDLSPLREVTEQAIFETVEATKSMLLPNILLGGITGGIYHSRVSAEAKKNFQSTKTSQQLPIEFLAVPKEVEIQEKKTETKTEEKKTELKTEEKETQTEEKEVEKLEPIKGVVMRGRFVPTNETENQKAREAQERGASVVEVEVLDSLEMDETQTISLTHKAAIQTGGKVVGEDKVVYDTQEDLNKGIYLLKNAIIETETKDNEAKLTIRNEDGSYNELTLGLATEEEQGQDPDLSYVENPEAPYQLSRMTEERALEWSEREILRKTLGNLQEHTGGKITNADMEASIDFLKVVSETVQIPTDEFAKKIVNFKLVTDMKTPQGELGNANISYTTDELGQKSYTITVNNTANVGSLVHEVGHLLRGLASKEQLQDFVDHYGRGDTAIWLDDIVKTPEGKYQLGEQIFESYEEAKSLAANYEEQFADDCVTYLKTGEAPTTALQNIFRRIKAVLQKIYNRYGYKLDPEVKNAFDKLFANEQNFKETVTEEKREISILKSEKSGTLYETAYHGTHSDVPFEKFDNTIKQNTDAPLEAYFFTDNPEVALTFTGFFENTSSQRIYKVNLTMNNPLVVDFEGDTWQDPKQVDGKFYDNTNELVIYAKENGYDSCVFKNVRDKGYGDYPYKDEYGRRTDIKNTDYVVFSNDQIEIESVGVELPIDNTKQRVERTSWTGEKEYYYVPKKTITKKDGLPNKLDLKDPTILYEMVFHGSPYVVDKFSTKKIGTGEGSAAFGWGIYVTQSQDVASIYATKLSEIKSNEVNENKIWFTYKGEIQRGSDGKTERTEAESYRADAIWSIGNAKTFYNESKEQVILDAQKTIEEYNRIKDDQKYQKGGPYYQVLLRHKENAKKAEYKLEILDEVWDDIELSPEIDTTHAPRIYNIQIPDQGYLSWNEKVDPKIKDIIAREYKKVLTRLEDIDQRVSDSKTLGELYRNIAVYKPEVLSQILSEQGYVGIKYPVGSASDNPSKTESNFVIFKDEDVQIVSRKNLNTNELFEIGASERFKKDSNTLYETVAHKVFLEERVADEDLDMYYGMIEDIRDVGGYVDENGYVTLYHRTSADNAKQILKDGYMIAKEDGLFFSTKKDGQNMGYGEAVVNFEIPVELLEMDDMFDDEIHFRLPIKHGEKKDITDYLFEKAAPTDSDEFKKWFSGSKVVDENGNPLVVSHGTPNGGFTEFKMPDYPSSLMSQQGGGYYFTDKKNAEQYMENVGGKFGSNKNKQLYNVYLSIKNPLIINKNSGKTISLDQFTNILKEGNREWFFTNWIYFDGDVSKDVNRDEALMQYAKKVYDRSPNDAKLLSESVRAFLGSASTDAYKKVLGFDGVKYSDQYGDIWVAWDNTQIKSIDNKGGWSIETGNILFEKLIDDRSAYDMAYHGSTYIFDKMGSENIGEGGHLDFGWGLYLTKEEYVAESYADTGNKSTNHILYAIEIPDGNYLKWRERGKSVVTLANDFADYILDLDQKGNFENRRETSPFNYNLTAKEIGEGLKERMSHPEIQTVEQFYKFLEANIGSKLTSELLRDMGYIGVKYDYFGGEDLNSFVIFNSDDLKIMSRKNLDTNELFEKAAPINSKAFQAWFGDSKVVDSKGKPLLVYHGTMNQDRFTTFDAEKGFNIDGIYHTSKKSVAAHWSGTTTVSRFKNISKEFENLKTIDEVVEFAKNNFDYKHLEVKYEPQHPAYDINSSDPWLNQPTAARWTFETDSSWGALKTEGKIVKTEKEALTALKEMFKSDLIESENATRGNGTLYANYLKIENPLEVDAKGEPYHNILYNDQRVNTEHLANVAKELGHDGVIVKNVKETNYENIVTDDYIVFEPSQIKSRDNIGSWNIDDPNILYESGVREYLPKVRGGWTEAKIIRALKEANHKPKEEFHLAKEIVKFDDGQDLLDHLYYHGTGGFISGTLRPSVVFSDRKIEQIGGGGYGDKYWGISVSKRKRTAEVFSGTSDLVSIYPVILDKEAHVIERLDLEDAIEIEDEIVQFWEDGVDAVWIGGGEQELVVLNPYAIHVYDQAEMFKVFGGLKSEQTTIEQAEKIYNQAKINVKLTKEERAYKRIHENGLDNYLFEKAQSLTLEDLDMMGIKSFVPILSDRNIGGVSISGMKSVLLPETDQVKTFGGVRFPEVSESGENIVWAVDKKGAATRIYNKAVLTAPVMANGERSNKGYGIVVMMGDDSHKSNRTAVDGYMRIFDAYLKEDRITTKNLTEIYKLVKGNSNLVDMPNFENKEVFDDWLEHKSTFVERQSLMEGFSKPSVQALGLPPMGLYLRQIAETEYNVPNMQYGDGLLVLELDLDDFSVKLGESGSDTIAHPAYNIGIKGRIVGKLPMAIGRDILFDGFKTKSGRSINQLMTINDYTAVRYNLPLIELNDKFRKVIKEGQLKEIKGSKPANMLVDFLTDNWVTSDLPAKDGGIKASLYISALLNNIGAESLSTYSIKDLNKALRNKVMKLYKLKGAEVYFSTSREKAWYSDFVEYVSEDVQRVTDSDISLTGVVSNELNVKGSLAIIMGKAIEEGVTILDAYEVKSATFPDGKLPTLYGKHGFEVFGRVKWNEKEFLKEHTKTELKDLKAYWKSEGWDEAKYGMPDIVGMRLNEEKIGGRDGYIRRLVSENEESIWLGSSTEGLARKSDVDQSDRDSSRQYRDRERNGGESSGDSRSSLWRSRRSSISKSVSELFSLTEEQAYNLGIHPDTIQKLKETYQNQDNTLYELSDEVKAQVLEDRKADVKKAIEDYYWIPDDVLKEYANEDWAKNEMKFRDFIKKNPGIIAEAKNFIDENNFLEHIQTSEGMGDYKWVEEDITWFKRVHAYSRILTPKEKDAQFIRLHTVSNEKLINLSRRLRNYEDVKEVGDTKKVVYKWGVFDGVSPAVKNLSKKSTDVEFEKAKSDIERDPRAYRKALQVVAQAEERVSQLRGNEQITGDSQLATREAYYDQLGEELSEVIDPTKFKNSINKYTEKEKLKSLVEAIEDQSKVIEELQKLGAESESNFDKLKKDLKSAKQEAKDLKLSLSEESKIIKELQSELKDKSLEATKSKQLSRLLTERRERVAELRKQLSEQNQKVRTLSNKNQSLNKRLEANRTRETLTYMNKKIKRLSKFNDQTIDAVFEEKFQAVERLFKDKKAYPIEFEDTQYFVPQHVQWIKEGKMGNTWSLDHLLLLENSLETMRLDGRTLLDEKITRRSNRLQNIAIEMYRQTYGVTPEVSPTYGSIMNDIVDELMRNQQHYDANTFNNIFDTVKSSIGKMQRIAREIDGYTEGIMYDLLVRQAYENMTEELRESYRRLELADKKMVELGITANLLAEDGFEYTTQAGQKVKLSKSEVIGLYVYSKNDLGLQKLVHVQGNNIDMATLGQAISTLTDNEKAWGDYMIDSLGSDDVWERQAAIYYNVYNRNLGRRDNYFTFIGKDSHGDEGKADLINGTRGSVLRYVDKSFTHEVNPKAIYPLKLNVTSSFTSQIKKQEHFINWAAWVRDMNYLMERGAIGKIIEMEKGPKYKKVVQDYINDVGSPQTLLDDIERLGSKVISNASVAALSLNFLTMLKQLASFSAAIRGDIGMVELLSVSTRLMNPQSHAETVKFIHEMSPYMKKRAISVEVEKYNATDFDTKAGRAIADFNEKIGMKGIYLMDQAAVNTLWLAAYDTYLRKNPNNLEGEALKKEAAFKATQLISETQPTSIVTDLASIQRKKGPFVRSVLLFTNQMFQYINMVWYDIPTSVKAYKATKDKQYMRKAFGSVMNMAISGALIMLVSGVVFKKDDEDDEEYFDRIGKEVLKTTANYTVPLAGNSIAQGASGFSPGSIVELPTSIGRLIGTDFSDLDKVSDRLWDILLDTASISGLPTAFVQRAIKAARNENLFEFLGSNYADLWETR